MLFFQNFLKTFQILLILSNIRQISFKKQLFIPGVTVSNRMDSSLTELGFESPSLIGGWYNLQNIYPGSDGDYLTKITTFVSIWEDTIGYLPPAIQFSLIRSINANNNNETIFNKNNFIKLMKEEVGDNGEVRIKLIYDSLFNYVKKINERIPIGLGCLQKVAEQYGTKNKRNAALLEAVTKGISEIIEKQTEVINQEYEFIYQVGNILNQRLKYLFNFTVHDFNLEKDNNNRNKLINIQNKTFQFSKKDDITSSLMKLFKVKKEFNMVLAKNTLLAQANIGQMEGCVEDKEINEDAGISSYLGSPVQMKKRGEYVAHNFANGTRSDGKTQNGYSLNFGFGLGKELIPGTTPHKNLIPYKYYENIQKLKSISNDMIKDDSFMIPSQELSKILNDVTRYDSNEPGLTENLFPNETKMFYSKIPNNELNNFSIVVSYSNSKYKKEFFGDIESEETEENEENEENEEPEEKEKEGTLDYSIYKGIFGIFNKDWFIVTYAKKSDGTLVYEMSLNGHEIKNPEDLFGETLNACFGVIYSGGKNDKDTCRNAFKKKCGNELDYRCKESGLYDILTENPIPKNDFPKDCSDLFNDSCFAWVNKHILGGGLIIRPSIFSSLSLILQRYSNKNDEFYDNILSNETNDDEPELAELMKYIEKPFVDINDLNVAMKKTVFYQVNHSLYLNRNFFLLIILFIF